MSVWRGIAETGGTDIGGPKHAEVELFAEVLEDTRGAAIHELLNHPGRPKYWPLLFASVRPATYEEVKRATA